MRLTKPLTLAAVAVLAAACSGTSPTAPAQPLPSTETGLVAAQALDVAGAVCRDITEVKLRMRPSPTFVNPEVEASYFREGMPVKCAQAPAWQSRPKGRIVPTRDPFVVTLIRTTPSTLVEIAATAPNGVRGSIKVR